MSTARRRAKDPTTPPAYLHRLTGYNPKAPRQVARNPNTPVHDYLKLAVDYPFHAARNPLMRMLGTLTPLPWENTYARLIDHYLGAAHLIVLSPNPRPLLAHLTDELPRMTAPNTFKADLALLMLINPRLEREDVERIRRAARPALKHDVRYHRALHPWPYRPGAFERPRLITALQAARLEDDASVHDNDLTRKELEVVTRLGWISLRTLAAGRRAMPHIINHALLCHPDTHVLAKRALYFAQRRVPSDAIIVQPVFDDDTPHAALRRFWQSQTITRSVAALLAHDLRADAPATLVQRLVLTPEPYTRMLLATRATLPTWALRRLARDGDVRVVYWAARALARRGVRRRGRYP